MVESSNEIERMLNKEIMEQKRIGRGSHNKVSRGERAKSSGYWKGLSKFDKPYTKNSKTKIDNVYENVLSYDELMGYDDEMQSFFILEWRNRHTNNSIIESLGISPQTYYKLLDKLNIKEKEGKDMKERVLSKEEMNTFKEEIIPARLFKAIPDEQKYELVLSYQENKNMSNKDIAEAVGYNKIGTFNTKKSQWKKAYENRDVSLGIEDNHIEEEVEENGNEIGINDYDDDFMLGSINSDNEILEKNDVNNTFEEENRNKELEELKYNYNEKENNEVEEVFDESHMSLNLTGKYKGSDLSHKLHAFASLINNDSTFTINISVVEESSSDKGLQIDRKTLERLIAHLNTQK